MTRTTRPGAPALLILGPLLLGGTSLRASAAETVNGATFGLAGACDLVVDVAGNPFTCS